MPPPLPKRPTARARKNLWYPGYGYIPVVVNFLYRVIFILFQLHWHTLPYPKTKEKQKIPEIKKYLQHIPLSLLLR